MNGRPSLNGRASGARTRSTGGSRNSIPSRTPQTIGPAGGHAASGSPNSRLLMSRRGFLYGAIGVGAAAAVGVGAFALSRGDDSNSQNTSLKVPESSVTPLTNLTALDSSDALVQTVADHDLTYGTLVFMNDDELAACLLPTETGSPLAQIGLLMLGSGNLLTVREEAVGTKDGYEIYDVRATTSGAIWTEANALEGAWRVYGAKLSQSTLGEPMLLEEGDATYETPTLAAVGTRAFWQVMPKSTNTDDITSRLMGATFGKDDASCVYENARRMATPVYASNESVVITPRVDSGTACYELLNIDANSGETLDSLTLPSGMKPLEAGYGKTGFMFSFTDIYNYGDGISNLGTYTPMAKPNGTGTESYSSAKWFSFARTPTAAPSWAGDLLIVKSSYAVCGVDLLDEGDYFAIDVENGADTYGEYLASTGVHDTFVTYTNIDHTPVDGEATHACRVKVWSPLSSSDRKLYEQEREAERAESATSA